MTDVGMKEQWQGQFIIDSKKKLRLKICPASVSAMTSDWGPAMSPVDKLVSIPPGKIKAISDKEICVMDKWIKKGCKMYSWTFLFF